MRILYFVLILLVSTMSAMAQSTEKIDFSKGYYEVQCYQGEMEDIKIDGNINDSVWKKVNPITRFRMHWNQDEIMQKTSLRLYHNGKKLFFIYVVEDSEVVVEDKIVKEMDIANEDRVEFIFDTDKKMETYYCFEIDWKGRVLDYKAKYFRKFDDTWNMPGLEVAGSRTKNGYIVEGAFDLDYLRKLNVLKKDGTMRMGFFRADFRKDQQGELVHRWISWVDSQTDEPEFHVPSSLGTVKLL